MLIFLILLIVLDGRIILTRHFSDHCVIIGQFLVGFSLGWGGMIEFRHYSSLRLTWNGLLLRILWLIFLLIVRILSNFSCLIDHFLTFRSLIIFLFALSPFVLIKNSLCFLLRRLVVLIIRLIVAYFFVTQLILIISIVHNSASASGSTFSLLSLPLIHPLFVTT